MTYRVSPGAILKAGAWDTETAASSVALGTHRRCTHFQSWLSSEKKKGKGYILGGETQSLRGHTSPFKFSGVVLLACRVFSTLKTSLYHPSPPGSSECSYCIHKPMMSHIKGVGVSKEKPCLHLSMTSSQQPPSSFRCQRPIGSNQSSADGNHVRKAKTRQPRMDCLHTSPPLTGPRKC